jgi:hypothetical protein
MTRVGKAAEGFEALPERDVLALMREARAAGRAGIARKVQPVDARPALRGEVVVTTIAGEGRETRSRPAEPGDMVVRSRSAETGNECYLVTATAFAARYEGPLGGADGWQVYRPKGKQLRFTILRPGDGSFRFATPWGEPMIARPGDALVQDPEDPQDIIRVAAKAFAATYEVVEPAGCDGLQ